MDYVPALDGLRAVAVGAVFVFHLPFGYLRGGFTGVDVFYVLSGFLITSIVLHDLRQGTFTLRDFYARRVQRILPNAIVTTLAAVVLARVLMLASSARQVAQHALWSLANASNFYILNHVGGYWDAGGSIPLLHTWSLAIEEQFYLVFPAAALALWGLGRRSVVAALITATLLSSTLSVLWTREHPQAAFYMLPARGWELLIGAALAVSGRAWIPRVLGEVLGWVGLAVLLGSFVWVSDEGFPGTVALFPTLATLAVLVSAIDPGTSIARGLSHPAIVEVGKLSYSLYLWHWPLIVMGSSYARLQGASPRQGAVLGACASVVLAVAANRLVERPLREKRLAGRRTRMAVILAGLAIAAVTSGLLAARSPGSGASRLFDPVEFRGLEYSAVATDPARLKASARMSDVVIPPIANPSDVWRTGGVLHLYGGPRPRVVVFGSSHALMYSHLIDEICRERKVSVGFLAADATPIFFSGKQGGGASAETLARRALLQRDARRKARNPPPLEFDQVRRTCLAKWKPDLVIGAERWSRMGSTPQRLRRDLVDEVLPYARSLLLLSETPTLDVDDGDNLRDLVAWRFERSGTLPRLGPDAGEAKRLQANRELRELAASVPGVALAEVDAPFLETESSVRWHIGRVFLFADRDHLSSAGADVARGSVERAVDEALAGKTR